MKFIRKGKVKEVYDNGEELLFIFTDQISVFDKIIPSLVPGKGESLARTSAFWFKRASEMGIRNHFINLRNGNEMVVRKFKIIEGKVHYGERGYLIPLEFVMRYYVAGSLLDRIENGRIDFRDLGFKRKPAYGEKLPEPLFEVTTKFEKTDRPLGFDEAREIGGLDNDDLEEIRKIIEKMDEDINRTTWDRGLIHADGKKEFAMDEERNPILVDTFGTADEDRFWEREEFEKEGKILERSKEFVRQYYRELGYHEKLMKARAAGLPEPDIPPLPPSMIEETRKLYISLYERITGEHW
ncbi:MAG: phosphoribosylaminoimidazolesuccinocarboxamide synthase [Thermoplasmatales archaeon]